MCVETILLGVRCKDLTLEHGVLPTLIGDLDSPMPDLRLTHDNRALVTFSSWPKKPSDSCWLAEKPWTLQLRFREALRNCHGSVNFPAWAVFSVGVGQTLMNIKFQCRQRCCLGHLCIPSTRTWNMLRKICWINKEMGSSLRPLKAVPLS